MTILDVKLYEAIETNDPRKVTVSVNNGSDPNAVINKLGWLPLQVAIECQSHDAFDALLASGADVNGSNQHGFTILHHAVDCEADFAIQNGEIPQLDFSPRIIENGANINAKDARGQSALELARQYQYTAFLDFVRNKSP